jgi:hypothetical protein
MFLSWAMVLTFLVLSFVQQNHAMQQADVNSNTLNSTALAVLLVGLSLFVVVLGVSAIVRQTLPDFSTVWTSISNCCR